jgi:putative ABC transport system permease protein
MNIIENMRLAWESVKANKMRSILTMLGIIIGIGSVIAILTVGNGMSGYVSSSMSSLGATNITVYLQERSESSDFSSQQHSFLGGSIGGEQPMETDLINDEMIFAMEKRYAEQIAQIGLSHLVGGGKAKEGRLSANINLTGVNADYDIVNNLSLLEGRFITENNVLGNRNVAVVSDKLVNNMFSGESAKALGQELKVYVANDVYVFKIIGIYEFTDPMMMSSFVSEKDLTTDIYIPITTAKNQTGAAGGYQSFTVSAEGTVDSAGFANTLKEFFAQYYVDNNSYTVSTMSMKSLTEQFDSIMNSISIAIAAIAAISLLVGGIGVMNIMLVSVTERTREIGVRKALGATNGNIRLQFVIESTIVCLIGGLFGVILGFVLGYVASSALGFPSFPTPFAVALAVLFSIAVGVFFGYYPANKAAKLDPIEALRYE